MRNSNRSSVGNENNKEQSNSSKSRPDSGVSELKCEVTGHTVMNKEVFYRVDVQRGDKTIAEFLKSYKDFRDLHESLRLEFSGSEESIEELPNKGNLGLFPSEKKVIEYRVFALQVHLKYLLNHKRLRESDALKGFLGLE